MPLYHHFATYYDRIFPEQPQTKEFFLKHLKKGRVLDLGCATGTYVSFLRRQGYLARGIDLDKAMINEAMRKYPSIQDAFTVLDMTKFDIQITYQSIYCIGNSLVHLPHLDAISTLFKRVFDTLEHGGVFIIQIINYERILSQNISSLPTISRDGLSFERAYFRLKDHLQFHTTLVGDGEWIVDDTLLIPLEQPMLKEYLTHVGFTKLEWYGSFDGAPYDADLSLACIVVATK